MAVIPEYESGEEEYNEERTEPPEGVAHAHPPPRFHRRVSPAKVSPARVKENKTAIMQMMMRIQS